NRFAPPADPRFPYVLTTYRLTEHHTGGGMSRFLSHLSELQPEMFVEMSPELAAKLKIDNSDYVCIVSLRGAIEARALVRRRRPVSHQICIPNSRPWALQAGEDSRVVTARREKQCERQVTNAMVSEFRYRRRNSDHKPAPAQFRRGKC